MAEPILKIEKIKKNFGPRTIFENVSLDVYPGEIFGLIGLSGSGKTTFLKTIIGFLRPDSGRVIVQTKEGYRLVREKHGDVKKNFGFAAQVPSFYEKLTVLENLDYFGALYHLSREARLTNGNTLLDLVELSSAKDIQARNLSGGMQRRLDIACSLIHSPSVLILDEPTSDLDPVLARQVWQLIQKINKRGTTIIVASHHFDQMEAVCNRIGIIAHGQLLKVGTLHDLTHMMSKGQDIHIETYPGNYEKIMKTLKSSSIIHQENRGNELIVSTTKPDKILAKVLGVLHDANETLIDVRISKLNLNDVFKKAIKDENRKNN